MFFRFFYVCVGYILFEYFELLHVYVSCFQLSVWWYVDVWCDGDGLQGFEKGWELGVCILVFVFVCMYDIFRCNILQDTATLCNTLQHTATGYAFLFLFLYVCTICFGLGT